MPRSALPGACAPLRGHSRPPEGRAASELRAVPSAAVPRTPPCAEPHVLDAREVRSLARCLSGSQKRPLFCLFRWHYRHHKAEAAFWTESGHRGRRVAPRFPLRPDGCVASHRKVVVWPFVRRAMKNSAVPTIERELSVVQSSAPPRPLRPAAGRPPTPRTPQAAQRVVPIILQRWTITCGIWTLT